MLLSKFAELTPREPELILEKEASPRPTPPTRDSKPLGWGSHLGSVHGLPQAAGRCSSSRQFPAPGLCRPPPRPSSPWAPGPPRPLLSRGPPRSSPPRAPTHLRVILPTLPRRGGAVRLAALGKPGGRTCSCTSGSGCRAPRCAAGSRRPGSSYMQAPPHSPRCALTSAPTPARPGGLELVIADVCAQGRPRDLTCARRG